MDIPTTDIEKLRHSFRPPLITTLFIGESSPPSGTFFYSANSILYSAMKEAFDGSNDFLVEFKSKGYFLDDLILFPVDITTKKQQERYREECRRNRYQTNIPTLAQRIIAYRPQGVVVLLAGIEEAVLEALERAKAESSNRPPQHYGTTPFPTRFPARRQRFLEEMGRIVPKLPLIGNATIPSTSKKDTALQAIEKALTLLRSVQTLESTDKDSMEHLLKVAVKNLRTPTQSVHRLPSRPSQK